MFKFLNLEPEIFGLEINDLSLRIAKIVKNHRGFNLVSFNETKIKTGTIKEGIIYDEDDLVKTIRLAVDTVIGKKLGTKYIVASLPEEKSFSQIIQMPKMTKEELRLAVPIEAENYIPLTISSTHLDFQVIDFHDKDGINHLDLLINVIPKSVVESYVICFKRAGLIPYVLEIESQAIVRSLIKKGQKNPPLLLIDLGVASTSFVIFSDDSVRFTSSVPICSKDLTDEISKKLGNSLSEAEELKIKYGLSKNSKNNIGPIIRPILANLVLEIKKYINFYNNHSSHDYFLSSKEPNSKIEKIIICGGGANLKGFFDFIVNELKILVEIGDPFVNIFEYDQKGCQMIPQQRILSSTTVLGLALRGANEKFKI